MLLNIINLALVPFNMKNKLLIVFSFLLLASCKPIMMKMYGIKNPEIENEKTIIKKALKYHLDTSNILSVSSQYFLEVFGGQSIPDAAIYDQNGKYIEYRQTDTSCNAGLFRFIPDLNLSSQYKKPGHLTLNEELERYRDLKGNSLNKVEPADFYLFIYWTVWTGKLNKDHVKIWEDLARENKNCKIKVMKVNLDLQAYWDEKEREKIMQVMHKKK
jgi:hypothetical protein